MASISIHPHGKEPEVNVDRAEGAEWINLVFDDTKLTIFGSPEYFIRICLNIHRQCLALYESDKA